MRIHAENIYVEIPQVDLKKIVAENSEIHEDIDSFFQFIKRLFLLLISTNVQMKQFVQVQTYLHRKKSTIW